MAEKTIEILQAGEGFATYFPSYNAVYDGEYLENWDKVVEKLENSVNLEMDITDFLKLKKADAKSALALKFRNGGYDSGACPLVRDLKTGTVKPCRAKGIPRPKAYNMIVLDADENLPDDFDKKLNNVLKNYEYYVHSTISSCANNKRRRILIPLKNPVNLDLREAFIRFIANEIGMECFDKASIRNKQMMCFPVHCKNSEIFHFHNKNEFMDESFLPESYKNVENWARWKDEADEKIISRSKRARKYFEETGKWTPIPDKNRIHDAYNKTYRISDILKDNGYVPGTVPGRWSHTYDDCADGIKVTNDSILYSYYGSDRLSVERDLDAFEVALILKHGNITDKENWKLMLIEASKDENVKKTMLNSLNVDLPDDAETWGLIYDSTEEGMAKRCLALYPHKIRNGKWWRYDNGIYKEANDASMLPDALQIVRIASALQPDDDDIRNMIGKVNTARNIVKAWQGLAMNQEDVEWEEKPWYLHFTDCVIDLEALCKGEKYEIPHNPNFFLTETTGYSWESVKNYDKKAFDEVITNMELYLPDEDIRNYFQMAMGRALTAVSASEDKCIWLMGPAGGNGKSTILNAIQGALGTYFYSMKGRYLYYNSKDGSSAEAPSPELAGMMNKRFVDFVEYDSIRTLDSEKYKNYTSAGYIKARKLHSDNDSFQAKCCCCVDSNGMPGLRRKENAILRRTRVIPFLTRFNGESDTKSRWMRDKKIHTAMMAWLIMGLQMWFANGMKLDNGIKDKEIPADVYAETMAWYNSFDDPDEFFNDFYEITNDEADFLIADDCWNVYQSQVYDKGATRHMFRQAEERWLREHGITTKMKKRVNDFGLRKMCYVGVRLVGTYESSHRNLGKYNNIEVVKEAVKEEPVKKVEVFNVFGQDELAGV